MIVAHNTISSSKSKINTISTVRATWGRMRATQHKSCVAKLTSLLETYILSPWCLTCVCPSNRASDSLQSRSDHSSVRWSKAVQLSVCSSQVQIFTQEKWNTALEKYGFSFFYRLKVVFNIVFHKAHWWSKQKKCLSTFNTARYELLRDLGILFFMMIRSLLAVWSDTSQWLCIKSIWGERSEIENCTFLHPSVVTALLFSSTGGWCG